MLLVETRRSRRVSGQPSDRSTALSSGQDTDPLLPLCRHQSASLRHSASVVTEPSVFRSCSPKGSPPVKSSWRPKACASSSSTNTIRLTSAIESRLPLLSIRTVSPLFTKRLRLGECPVEGVDGAENHPSSVRGQLKFENNVRQEVSIAGSIGYDYKCLLLIRHDFSLYLTQLRPQHSFLACFCGT
jgi:hypothetical protein